MHHAEPHRRRAARDAAEPRGSLQRLVQGVRQRRHLRPHDVVHVRVDDSFVQDLPLPGRRDRVDPRVVVPGRCRLDRRLVPHGGRARGHGDDARQHERDVVEDDPPGVDAAVHAVGHRVVPRDDARGVGRALQAGELRPVQQPVAGAPDPLGVQRPERLAPDAQRHVLGRRAVVAGGDRRRPDRASRQAEVLGVVQRAILPADREESQLHPPRRARPHV
mmetsp:Transcript_28077/g.86983  ORF Transcript_28077/g.86983 Transcript_28077/m.86983 type:complete len:219 (+) Transcript_28077:769-1425(+)